MSVNDYTGTMPLTINLAHIREHQLETGVVDPKRRVAQSVSGMVTHTSTCHVYRMDLCQMYET